MAEAVSYALSQRLELNTFCSDGGTAARLSREECCSTERKNAASHHASEFLRLSTTPFISCSLMLLSMGHGPSFSVAAVSRGNDSPIFGGAAETVEHAPCGQRNLADRLFSLALVA